MSWLELILLVFLLFSSILAIIFDATSMDNIRLLSLLLFVISSIIFIFRLRVGFKYGRFAIIFLIGGFLVWYAFPVYYNCWLNDLPLGADLPIPIDNKTIMVSLFYLSLFICSSLMSYKYFYTNNCLLFKFNNYINPDAGKIIVYSIVLILIGSIQYIISGLNFKDIIYLMIMSRIEEKPWAFWDNLGNEKSFYYNISQIILITGIVLSFMVTLDKRIKLLPKIIYTIIGLIGLSVIFIDQGTRSVTALIILPVIILIIENSYLKSKYKFISNTVLFSVGVLLLLQLQLYIRGGGYGLSIYEVISDRILLLGGSTDYFSETLMSVRLVPNYHDYFKESVLIHFLSSPIPRFLWPDKPASQIVWYYTLYRWGIDIYEGGGNVFPGIVGQYYMSWGSGGVLLIGITFGWITSQIDELFIGTNKICNNYEKAIALMLSTWLFLSYRIISPWLLYPILLSMVILYLGSPKFNNIKLKY